MPQDTALASDNDSQDRLKIFISYSRRNSGAATQIVAALEGQGFDVTIDNRDLPFGEEWQEELRGFIQDCDTVVWLVSPASVGSHWVNWELGEVQRAGKRLFPVVVEETIPEDLPKALGKIHLLPAKGVFQPQEHLEPLTTSLRTDRGWIKEHTRLGMIARAWDGSGRGSDRLLRGKALRAAEAWRIAKPNAAPEPDPLILNLLAASEHGAKRRQRGLIASLVGVAIVLAGLAVYAFIQQGVAVEQERIAVKERQTAERRAARLSVTTARDLRQQGFVPQGMLLLLNASEQFTDSDAPSALRIEMEKTLARRAIERARVRLPDGTMAQIKEGRLTLQIAGVDFPLPLPNASSLHQGPPRIKVDCKKMLRDGNYQIKDEFREPFYQTCETQGNFGFIWQTHPGASYAGGNEIYMIFRRDNPDPVMFFELPIDSTTVHWAGSEFDATFVHAEVGKVTVRRYYDPGPREITFDLTAGTPMLVSPDRMLLVTGRRDMQPWEAEQYQDPPDPEAPESDRWLLDISLQEKPVFSQYFGNEPPQDINDRAYDLDQTGPDWLNGAKSCQDYDRCEVTTPDGRWTARKGDAGAIQIFKAGTPDPVATLATPPFQRFRFLGNGPELVAIDNIDPASVYAHTPDMTGGSNWTRRLLYRGAMRLEHVETDPTGDVLILLGEVQPNVFRGLAYSLSARQVWRDFGTSYRERSIGYMQDGQVFTGTDFGGTATEGIGPSLHRFPSMSEMADMLEQALPKRCAPALPRDWTSSPCWPDGV